MIATRTWSEANQRHLTLAVEAVRARLERLVGTEDATDVDAADAAVRGAREDCEAPPALDALAEALGLTAFERELLLGAAAADLDAGVARLIARAHGDPSRAQMSFALAQAIFEDPHWSALTPGRPLRALRLVELGSGPLPSCPLSIAERVLHHLLGLDGLDERLQAWLMPLGEPGPLPSSHAQLAAALAERWRAPATAAVELVEATAQDRRQVLAAAALAAQRRPWAVNAAEVPGDPVERDDWLRVLQRELLLDRLVLVVEVESDPAPATREAVRRLAGLAGAVAISSSAPSRALTGATTVALPRLTSTEQRQLWGRCLGGHRSRALEAVTRAFDLSATDIATAAAATAAANGDLPSRLWQACREAARPELDGLAQRVHSRAAWADLVLPDDQTRALRSIVAHAPHRRAVADTFDATDRGHGLVVLLSGPSGTGKTLAAEVIANELSLDLFRVDLASVVSKWIGETEKHLRSILDAADRGSGVLLFDEADALFGKRSEVNDSHDRFANIEVGYLLQRLESYRGIALLATNLPAGLDAAFTRRIRYAVQFPHPDRALRERIWRRAFPPTVAVEGVDFGRLAALDVTGAGIHNIAIYAALEAAARGEPVTVEDVRAGTRREYAKLQRPLTQSEAEGLR